MDEKRKDSRTAEGSPGEAAARFRRCAGYSLLEIMVVAALIGFLAAIVSPMAAKWIRRSGDVSAYSTVRQALALARLEAIKRGGNVVVLISLSSENRIRLLTFQDVNGNSVQDAGEPTLGDVSLSPRIHFWKQGSSIDDITQAVRFDTYPNPIINGPDDSSLTNRIVFVANGGISPPHDSGSGPVTASGGRGIYFSEQRGKNFFRVTVESDLSGKARVDKYVQGSGYLTSGWGWL